MKAPSISIAIEISVLGVMALEISLSGVMALLDFTQIALHLHGDTVSVKVKLMFPVVGFGHEPKMNRSNHEDNDDPYNSNCYICRLYCVLNSEIHHGEACI